MYHKIMTAIMARCNAQAWVAQWDKSHLRLLSYQGPLPNSVNFTVQCDEW